MHESLPSALGRARARLNAVIALHRGLVWAAPSALASGILVAASRALGLRAAGLALWAALSLLGAAAGAFASRKSFLDEEDAARWLDARLGDDELLAAAVFRLRSGSEGRFDEELATKAEELLPRAAGIKSPSGPLAKRGALALAALAIGAYMIFLSGTMAASSSEAIARARAEAGRSSSAKAGTAAAALEAGGKAATEFAASLFPNDKRMATLTERALREGRIDDLRDILKAAGLELDSKLAGSLTESERKKLARDRDRMGDAIAALARAAQAQAGRKGGAPGGGMGSEGPEGGKRRPGSGPEGFYADQDGGKGQGSGSPRSPGKRDGSPNAASGDGSGSGGGKAEAADGGEGPAGKGGKGYGRGSGAAGDWGEIEPLAGRGRMDLAEPKAPKLFELVLPGSEASQPVSNLALSSGKSAEAAMTREGLPLEYEDFVRSYFMSLSQGPR